MSHERHSSFQHGKYVHRLGTNEKCSLVPNALSMNVVYSPYMLKSSYAKFCQLGFETLSSLLFLQYLYEQFFVGSWVTSISLSQPTLSEVLNRNAKRR